MSQNLSERNILLLCCQGRAGSTLLLRILNTIKGFNIVGESKGASIDLIRFYSHIKFTVSEIKAIENLENMQESVGHLKFAWKNKFSYDKLISYLYSTFEELFCTENSRMSGLKEIRFGYGTYEEFSEDLLLLKELFPNLKVVFLTRDIEELLNSGWWAKDKAQSRTILTKQADYFRHFHSILQSEEVKWTYFLTFNDICNKTDTFIGMFNFLGESFSEEQYQNEISKILK